MVSHSGTGLADKTTVVLKRGRCGKLQPNGDGFASYNDHRQLAHTRPSVIKQYILSSAQSVVWLCGVAVGCRTCDQ